MGKGSYKLLPISHSFAEICVSISDMLVAYAWIHSCKIDHHLLIIGMWYEISYLNFWHQIAKNCRIGLVGLFQLKAAYDVSLKDVLKELGLSH